jgi:hypothetical protein
MKRVLAGLIVAAVLTGCTAGASQSTTTTTTTAATIASATTSTTLEPSTTVETTPPGIDDLPGVLQSQLEDLIGTAEDLRGLSFDSPPAINVVSPTELADLVRQGLEEDTKDIDVDEALYELLGLVEPGTDLLGLYSDVLGEQVAGFYDTDTKELVVPVRTDEFSPLERSVIVHELTHALTDEHFGLGARYDALFEDQLYDQAAAFQAVIEGDATFVQYQYLGGLGTDDQRSVVEESLSVETASLDAAPRFIQESLAFPYVRGEVFVQRMFELEGVDGVNALYSNPPVSTEQIISPEDYTRDQPIEVTLDGPVPDGYTVRETSTWGELGFEIMFNQVLGGRVDASSGWGGDEYRVLFNGSDVAMTLVFRGDTETDASEMESALIEYVTSAMQVGSPVPKANATEMSGDDYAYVGRKGDTVELVVASDPAVGLTLSSALAG